MKSCLCKRLQAKRDVTFGLTRTFVNIHQHIHQHPPQKPHAQTPKHSSTLTPKNPLPQKHTSTQTHALTATHDRPYSQSHKNSRIRSHAANISDDDLANHYLICEIRNSQNLCLPLKVQSYKAAELFKDLRNPTDSK